MAGHAIDPGSAGMNPSRAQPTTNEVLQALAREHPNAHPYTLSLLLQAQTGIQISGAKAVKLLAQE